MTTRMAGPGGLEDRGAEGVPAGEDAAAALRLRVRERVAAGKIDLPLLPQVASQVLMLAGNAHADAAQLSALIHRDPALAGQVLRIANSPSYMPRMPIVSLQQAVARLGLNTVTEIALVASMQSGTFKVPGLEAELRRLWKHAVASAVFAKEIARIRRCNVEAAFLCGLLHAVGKPALLQVVADEEARLPGGMIAGGTTRDAGAVAVIGELLQQLHIGVGLRIAEVWGLPRVVMLAISGYQGDQDRAGLPPEVVITCLADRLATHLTQPEQLDEETLRAHPVFGHLNLYPDDVVALLAKRAKVAAVVESMTS